LKQRDAGTPHHLIYL